MSVNIGRDVGVEERALLGQLLGLVPRIPRAVDVSELKFIKDRSPFCKILSGKVNGSFILGLWLQSNQLELHSNHDGRKHFTFGINV